MKRKKIDEDVLENIRWFLKFPLEKRLELSEKDSKEIEYFRKLEIKEHAGPKRSG